MRRKMKEFGSIDVRDSDYPVGTRHGLGFFSLYPNGLVRNLNRPNPDRVAGLSMKPSSLQNNKREYEACELQHDPSLALNRQV
jgi:hypothetical protein